MENSASLEELRAFVDEAQKQGADRNLVMLAQNVLAVLDWFEARLDALDGRQGD